MKPKINKIQLNLILGLSVITLSLLTIHWHHENYLLYAQSKKVAVKNHQLIALRKDLLSETSQTMSGAQIKDRAVRILKMKTPTEQNALSL